MSLKPKILFATTNDHKIRLFKIAWLNRKLDQEFELVTLNDIPKIDLGYIKKDSGSFTGFLFQKDLNIRLRSFKPEKNRIISWR